MKCAIVTHQKGSWKWQDRHAISFYEHGMLRNGELVWKYSHTGNNKVTPREVRAMRARLTPVHYGSLHNMPIAHSLACRTVDVL